MTMTALTTLVSTEELARHSEDWRIFDCRHDLAQPDLGEAQYREAHIPGALFAHLDRDLSAPRDGRNGRHPLPYPGAFIAWLGQQGLEPEHQVVCYDAGGGTVAARLWWMLRWVGHDAVAVLDGGFAKWRAEGRPVTDRIPRVAHTAYPVRLRPEASVGIGVVERAAKDLLLLDARAPERFRGEKEPIDRVAGHIPGAKNRYCNDNLTPQGVFKPAEQLKSEFKQVLQSTPPSKVVNYCGSGVAACHNLLAMEIAGLQGAKLYPGSWSDWITDPARPVAKDAAR
jgi:thiosulfate/3-mercaptopyruvate sulfurtransferase